MAIIFLFYNMKEVVGFDKFWATLVFVRVMLNEKDEIRKNSKFLILGF